MGFDARVLVAGEASGIVLRLEEPLSFWGGLDPKTGNIIDQRHPQLGENLAQRILVMAYGRGSSSSTGVLAEAIRLGTAPAAIILHEPDMIVMLGAMVTAEIYGLVCPVVTSDRAAFDTFITGQRVDLVDGGTTVRIVDDPPVRTGEL